MRFFIVTIFPGAFDSYFKTSILKRAADKKLIKVDFINPRNFVFDKRKTVDDKPFGGGPGMVMKAESILRAIEKSFTRPDLERKIILLSPRGKQFTQKMARDWARKYKNIILISGRYEGIDERVKKILRMDEISIGPYILSGGEIPAMVVVEAISRHIPGVLGKEESLEEKKGSYPIYTRPEIIKWKGKKYRVPKTLLSGNHKKIEEWRQKNSR